MTNFLRKMIGKSILPFVTIVAIALLLPATMSLGQNPSGTIKGSVRDSAGASIQHATVELKNTGTGDTRTVSSNDVGVFTFPAVPSGDYEITVSAPGFARFIEKGYHLDPGDSRSIDNIVLGVESKNETMVVEAPEDRIDTTSGETAALITSSDIEHLSVEGRDVTELLKILPGVAIAGQGYGNTAFDPGVVQCCTGTGSIGQYSADGTPISGQTLKWDGTNLTDPGANNGTLQNVNYDMVSEVKVQIGSFTAEESNGPVVINAVTKAGGEKFHGAAYTYARTTQLNSTDWLATFLGYQKPPDRYIYPGFYIGGPIEIPGTRFRNIKRANFFVGFEDYAQKNSYAYYAAANAIVHGLVPTANMRKGLFNSTELANYLGPNYGNGSHSNITNVPNVDVNGNPVTNGNVSATLDPGATVLFNRLPLPNVPSNGTYNYIQQNLVDNDMWQGVARTDFALSNNQKLFVRYSTEQGTGGVPEAPYYNPDGAPMGGANTPGGGLLSSTNSQGVTANLVTILSSTSTNVLSASLTYMDFEYKPKTPSALLASTYNYPYSGMYQNGSKSLPNFMDYGNDGMPLYMPGDYTWGPNYTRKFLPVVGDDFTKLRGRHELKTGVYAEQVTNNQRQINPPVPPNGGLVAYWMMPQVCGWMPSPCPVTDIDGKSKYYNGGNYLANEEQGLFGGYYQQNFEPNVDLYFWNVDGYVTDSWKARKNLTVNLGVRFEHLGTWDDRHNTGIAVFNPSTLNQQTSDTLPLPGFDWHGIDKNVPLSGVKSRFGFWEPRLGVAWDMTGKGRTVLRAGYGQYRYHDSYNDISPAEMVTQGVRGVQSIAGSGGITLKGISGYSLDPASGGNANVSATGLAQGDNNQALTHTYTLAIDHNLGFKTQIEVAYIGNHTTNLNNTGSQDGMLLSNLDSLPYGALFAPGSALIAGNASLGMPSCYQVGVIPTPECVGLIPSAAVNSYRKYGSTPYDPASGQVIVSPYGSVNNYSSLTVPAHVAYSNYNGFQVSAQRQSNNLRYGVNYTFGKSLGILGSENGGGNPIDATNLAANYGITPFDRTHIFNANYSYSVGKVVDRPLVGALVNGWEISGITGVQSGQNLEVGAGVSSPNFGAQILLSGADYGGTAAAPVSASNTVLLGTTDIIVMPTFKCDPRSGLARGQRMNGNCFSLGAQTAAGPIVNGPDFMPYMRGPAWVNSDLAMQKQFRVGESRQLQLRYSAFNFLNHPLSSFNSTRSNEYTLNMAGIEPGDTVAAPGSGSSAWNSVFGNPTLKQGRRVSEVSLKFIF